jgi:hypothetical protein
MKMTADNFARARAVAQTPSASAGGSASGASASSGSSSSSRSSSSGGSSGSSASGGSKSSREYYASLAGLDASASDAEIAQAENDRSRQNAAFFRGLGENASWTVINAFDRGELGPQGGLKA